MSGSPIDILQAFLAAAKDALEMAETEMRYADWGNVDPENGGRNAAYVAVCKALHIAEHGLT